MKLKTNRFKHWTVLMASALALTACGGGGGGESAAVEKSACIESSVGGETATASVAGKITIAGIALNCVHPNKLATNGGLDYANPVNKPMRGVVVELVQGTTVLATAPTATNGSFTLIAPANAGSAYLRIKAELKNTLGASYDIQIKDNTNGDALYALATSPFNVGNFNITQNMTADSGWSTAGEVIGTRASAPFAILDTVYSAIQKVVEVAPTTVFPAVTVFWSVNNTTASGDLGLGQIGTSYFTSVTSGGLTKRVSYILGKAGVDTDEFDESVVAHEWGHYAQNAFSRDDSVGGSHTFSDKLDMRVAFSEGWGNAWSGIATGRSKYADSAWSGSSPAGFTLSLNSSPAAGNRGWFSENSVLYMIYDLNQQVGFGPIWQALLAIKTTPALTSIYSFHANLPAGGASTAMTGLMAGQNITGTGIYGVGETNQATLYQPYSTIKVGDPATPVCLDTGNGTPNKLGNYAAFRFNAALAGVRTFSVTGGTDPDFEVFQKRVKLQAFTSTLSSEVASVSLDAGDAVIVVNDDKLTSGSSCLTVRIQ